MKRILFLTGTRADFGKIKSLINILQQDIEFDVRIFITGMHMHALYGSTCKEVEMCGYKNIFKYINHTSEKTMDLTLARTIEGLSSYIKEFPVELIVVHGDRVEALAGAIVGSLNNILVAHVEGGELSGTIDDLIRHAVSKMSHIHFVCNDQAKQRLIQLGECKNAIFNIGSPDMDLMFSENLPDIQEVKRYYEIPFDQYAIVMYHPVTTEYNMIEEHVENLVSALLADDHHYVVIYPNNDLGSNYILRPYRRFFGNSRFRIFPSIRFEYFLTLLKFSDFLIGNSSAGIREAPVYGIPSIDIGTRQKNRASATSIINCGETRGNILKAIQKVGQVETECSNQFGNGNSNELFYKILKTDELWKLSKQKEFNDILMC